MRLIAFGGDERMRGRCWPPARGLGDACISRMRRTFPTKCRPAQAVMLPWPRSFREERLISAKGGLERERVLARSRPAARCWRAAT